MILLFLIPYIPDNRLEEEKARRCHKVYKWETATYGKIWYADDIHNLRSVEIEFSAIVFNDELTYEEALSYEPTVSSLNDNEIDFRISSDESNDKDYTIIFDKKSFSYKIISVNDLKTDSENDNDKVDMPLFPSPEPTVSYFNDLDFFNDFEKEFPAIAYVNALTKPTISPQHINELDLKDETSMSEYDKEEQNILYFNDLFHFNKVYLDNLKPDKDNDDNEIDIIQSSREFKLLSVTDLLDAVSELLSFVSEQGLCNMAYPWVWDLAVKKSMICPLSSTTMGDENPIRTLGDCSKTSHEGYRNTIELLVWNNMVPLRPDTIRTTKLRNDILKMPYKIEQYNLLSNLEKQHTKHLRNEKDKKRGVEYVMSKILGFYKECLELGPEYVTGLDDEGEVT
nr:protein kinase-like domain, concanavalin A-like lectin/glucanase domain protein [Tanacetum cinerariifolium]